MAEYANQKFKKGDTILEEGDHPHCAYILMAGSVEIIKKRNEGGDLVISTLESGSIFGEMSMVDAEPRSASVRALEDVDLMVVDAPTFKKKQESLDVFSRKLVRTLIQRLRIQNQQIADMSDPSELLKAAKKGQITATESQQTNVLVKENYREKINFGAIRLLFGDLNPQSRQGIKGGLHMQGFREIEDVNNINDLRTRVQDESFDLIIVDSTLGVQDSAKLIDDIRNNKTACSPFAVIFAIIETPDPKTLEKLAEAGLDDVLVKPVALGNIIDRVERRIKKRKSFVVTMQYIGPDRRSGARPGAEAIPLIDVPNPVAFKALGSKDSSEFEDHKRKAIARIEALKIERHVVQIDWFRGKIETLVAEDQDPTYFMGQCVEVTKALIFKLKKKSRDIEIQLCERILTMIDDFQAGMAQMSGDDWDRFTSLTKKLRTDLGPKS